jgi:hypothetical protein
MSGKQGITHTPSRTFATLAHSKAQMGKHIHGFHHRATKDARKGLHIHSGGQVNKIFTLLFHSYRLQCSTGGRTILQGDFQVARTPKTIVSDRDSRFMSTL